MFRNWITLVVLVITYGGLGLGRWPGLGLNRPTIALVGAAALVAVGAMTVPAAWAAMDAQTMVFLFSMMVVNGGLSEAGVLAAVWRRLVRHSRHPLGLLMVVTGGTGVLSAFLLNDTLALVATPLIVRTTQTLGLNPVPYLLALAGATNVGSLATLSGNPQNILVGAISGMSYGEFARVMAPVAAIGLVLLVGWVWLLYPEVRSRRHLAVTTLTPTEPLPPGWQFWWLVTGGLLGSFVAGAPLAEAALVTAGLCVCGQRRSPQRWLAQVDWELLVLFGGLFVLTQATQNLGILQPLAASVTHPWEWVAGVTLLSNLISNVPTVLLLYKYIPAGDTQGWLLLAASATLAGNLTLFGAVANLITVEAAARAGYAVGFGTHLRFGLPLTLATLGLAYGWIRLAAT